MYYDLELDKNIYPIRQQKELTSYLNNLYGIDNWIIKHTEDKENITIKIWKSGEKINFCYSKIEGWTKEGSY